MFRMIQRVFERAQEFFLTLVGVALALIMCIVFLQTFTRFVIFHSLPWSEELSRYLFVFILMIGLNVAIRDDMLIRIDLVDYVIKGVWQRIFAVVRNLVGLAVGLVISVNATGLFRIGMIQKSPAMRIPMIIMYSLICAGFAIASISMFFKLAESARALVQRDSGVPSEGDIRA
ncbi:MAG: TRAP transporter small permease [Synergistaceae bacterium]|nr:TRAP transporter small permease [Synergistaceae bacterium]